MPIHDWTRVETGFFHAFHHEWISEIHRALNRGILPTGYYALPEQQAAGFGPDVLTLHRPDPNNDPGTLATRPKTRFTYTHSRELSQRKKSTVVVRHISGDRIVAMLELVSPGNKSSHKAIRAFIEKAVVLIENQIHLLIVDLFPPTQRDPQGIHGAIWEEVDLTQSFELPSDKPLTLVAYQSGLETSAFVEPVAAGDALPDMPLFLDGELYVNVPLEATYQAAWAVLPERLRELVESSSAN